MFSEFEKITNFSNAVLDRYLLLCAQKKGLSDIILKSNDFFTIKKDKKIFKHSDNKKLTLDEIVNFLSYIYMPSSLSLLAQGKDLDFSYSIEESRGKNIMFRVNATSVLGKGNNTGVELVFRLLPSVPHIDSLNFSPYIKDNLVCKNISNNKGIFIVSGETSSGKSTLLAAVIREIVTKQSIHFLSFESPIEFDLNLPDIKSIVAQSEIPMHIESYPKATRNALRRNADLLLIGESRDRATIFGAIQAAITGHVVFTTTHTNNAHTIVSRMSGEFPEGERSWATQLLIESLRGIVHQELIARKGGGLIALQEGLFFSKEIKNEIAKEFDLVKGDALSITSILQEKIKTHGLTKINHARGLFKDGLIEQDTLNLIKQAY